MADYYRNDRPRPYGYRFKHQGKEYKTCAWDNWTDARRAERQKRAEVESEVKLPPNSLGAVFRQYHSDSMTQKRRSVWRLDGLTHTFMAHVFPHFSEDRDVRTIEEQDVEKFLGVLRTKTVKKPIVGKVGGERQKVGEIDTGRPIKNKTIKHIVTDLGALCNWCIKKKLLAKNPVTAEVRSQIGSTKFVKPPLNRKKFERAFSVLAPGYERAWWLTHECLGLRMDEGNRLLRTDVDFETEFIHVPGTKTPEAECYMPMGQVLQQELKLYLESRDDDSSLLFPGRSAQTTGKQIYSRRRLFEKIQRRTAFQAYMETHPGTRAMKAWKELKRAGYPGGVKLSPKELRDYFGTNAAAKTKDPNVLMRLMRHTNLQTTTKYMREVQEQMRAVVADFGHHGEMEPTTPRQLAACPGDAILGTPLGDTLGSKKAPKKPKKVSPADLAQAPKNLVSSEKQEGKFGGGGGSRTHDAADMSRVL